MLRAPFQARARSAVAPPGAMVLRMTAEEFMEAVARGSSDVALVDPTLIDQQGEILESLTRSHLGTVLYIELTPEYAKASIDLLRELGTGEIVTFGYNDDPVTFAEILRRQARANREQLLLRALKSQVAAMSPEVRRGIAKISEHSQRVDSADRLATLCGVTRGTLFRNFRAAGITSASGLVTGLSLLRNYDLLVDSSLTMRNLARVIGLGSERAVRDRLLKLSGLSFQEVRKPVLIEEFAERIASTLTGCRTPVRLRARAALTSQ